jgi:hypothetical protein
MLHFPSDESLFAQFRSLSCTHTVSALIVTVGDFKDRFPCHFYFTAIIVRY